MISAVTHQFAHCALSWRKLIVCSIKIQFKLSNLMIRSGRSARAEWGPPLLYTYTSNLMIIITDGEMQSDGDASDVVKYL
jgi:hypothetical protein